MAEPRSEFLRTVISRGFLHQCTDQDGLDALAGKGKPITAYIGFDCTADSLHVGSLVQIMLLRHLQKSGHRPVVLLGGGTTKVGDPSGKDESRKLLTEDEIARNLAGIKKIFERFLTFGKGPTDAVFVNNANWLDGLEYIPFLRDVGRHFSVNRMLGFDSVKLRLDREQPLSFLEFNYMVLQAYDFLELAKRQDCALQMGGSDQWGNIVSGVDLVRRKAERTVYGLTAPLITTANGEKMGKTAKGAVWLDADKVSAYDYWQFWRNAADADVGRFLRLFTELSLAEIVRLEKLQGAELNDAKKILANEATALLHGKEAAESAAAITNQTFGGTISAETRVLIEGVAGKTAIGDVVVVSHAELEKQISVVELFRKTGLATSNSESRRLIRGGGARVNDMPVTDETATIGIADVKDGIIKLSAGKKRHALIRVG